MATESRGCWDPGANAFVNEHFLAATLNRNTAVGKTRSAALKRRGLSESRKRDWVFQ